MATKKRKKVKPIPAGHHTVTPYLACKGAAQAMEFYQKAFGAKEVMRMPGPGGAIAHAEMQIGDSRIMLTDEYPEMDFLGPTSRGGTSVHIHLYVPDADKMAAQAVKAGGKLLRPVEEQFYGDRTGTIEDAWGHVWHLATHVKDVSMAQLRKAAAERAKGAEK